MPDIRPDISYLVIIRYPALFAGFITEAAVKHASTPTAAVRGDVFFPTGS